MKRLSKTYVAVIIIGLTIGISACSKEKKLRNSIIGTWDVTEQFEITYDSDGFVTQTTTEDDFTLNRYVFEEDGSGSVSYDDGSGTFDLELTWVYTYNKSTKAESLEIDLYGDKRTYSITKHVKNTSLDLDYDETFSGGASIDAEYTWTKQ